MDLSPNDIRNYEFPLQMRGYDREEVDNLLEQAAAALERHKQENLRLSMEVDSLKSQLSGLRQFEDTIKNAAIDARRNADMTVGNAKKEAELLLTKARTEAEKILGSRAQKVSDIEGQISKLQMARKSYLNKLRHLIKSHLEVLEDIVTADSTTTEEQGVLEVTETTDVTRQKLETIATKPSQVKPITAEEANAPDKIIPSAPEMTADAPAVELTDETVADEATSTKQALDPELAAALQSYKHEDSASPDTDQPSPQAEPVPAPGELVETTARAEDIPQGFIAGNQKDSTSSTTDKIQTDNDDQSEPTEHNAIDVDTPPEESKERPPDNSSMRPDNLADELDRVVAKFEEEMDKAEKTD